MDLDDDGCSFSIACSTSGSLKRAVFCTGCVDGQLAGSRGGRYEYIT